MKTTTARKLLEQYGEVIGEFNLMAIVLNGRYVEVYHHKGEVIDVYITEFLLEGEGVRVEGVARAIARLLYRSSCFSGYGRTVSVRDYYFTKRSNSVKIDREVTVLIDGVAVCGSTPAFDALLEGVLAGDDIGPLLDWVEEFHAAKSDEMILV